MLKKQYLKNGACKVTFELKHLPDAERVELLGDFNEWQPEAMKKYKNGKHKVSINLAPGAAYQFRYLIESERWENDAEADTYHPNEFGEENAVVIC